MLSRSDLTTQIATAINRAIAHYGRERFWFNEQAGSSFSTVANTRAYGAGTVPSYIQEIELVELATSSDRWPLRETTYSDLISASGDSTTTGEPTDWAWLDGSLYLYPTPDAVYTIYLTYQVGYADLSADTDSNDFTDNAQDLIENRAAWSVSLRVLRDIPAAQAYKFAEMEALQALLTRTGRLLHTGRVQLGNW
jgi:hypothetical protein